MATTARFRRLMVGLAMGFVVMLALFGTGARDAGAQPIRGIPEQNEFVDTCRDLGGSPRSIGPRSVKCTYPNGNSMSCNFANGGGVDACVTYVPSSQRTTGGGQPNGPQVADAPATSPAGAMVPLE